MPWKITGHMNADGMPAPGRNGFMHGPHPRKLWVGPHVERGRKVKAQVDRRRQPADENAQAEAYARWLAARDGIAIPEGAVAGPVVEYFESEHRTTGRHFWNGTRQVPKSEKRFSAVQFREVLLLRSSGRYGTEPKLGDVLVTIALPNWDFDPREPVEGIDEGAPDTLEAQLALIGAAMGEELAA